MHDDTNWEKDGRYTYDADRWDPDEKPDECQKCGSILHGAGDRSTVGQHCPECKVIVWVV